MIRQVELTAAQRQELERLRDTAAKAYLRERAAALLKIADGMPAAQVARRGLLRVRRPDTVYDWLNRYEAEGVAGLTLRQGRGRKPAFSPGASGCPSRQRGAAPLGPTGPPPVGP